MSHVLSHVVTRISAQEETTMKSFGLNDTFYIELKQRGVMGGTSIIRMALTAADAKVLKGQLEEFVAQNQERT